MIGMKIIHQRTSPKFLIVTPLRVGDKISKETLKTIKRNETPFTWVSYEGPYNIPINTTIGLNIYLGINKKENIKYFIKIDNDINADRVLLDEMYNTLESCKDDYVAYCYCPFKFVLSDGRAIEFKYREFDTEALLRANYITSNSMINIEKLNHIGGLVCDSYYQRLLDYATWLKFLSYGYEGITCKKGFTTPLQEGSISAGGEKDYNVKMGRVQKDFIRPLS